MKAWKTLRQAAVTQFSSRNTIRSLAVVMRIKASLAWETPSENVSLSQLKSMVAVLSKACQRSTRSPAESTILWYSSIMPTRETAVNFGLLVLTIMVRSGTIQIRIHLFQFVWIHDHLTILKAIKIIRLTDHTDSSRYQLGMPAQLSQMKESCMYGVLAYLVSSNDPVKWNYKTISEWRVSMSAELFLSLSIRTISLWYGAIIQTARSAWETAKFETIRFA